MAIKIEAIRYFEFVSFIGTTAFHSSFIWEYYGNYDYIYRYEKQHINSSAEHDYVITDMSEI